MIKQVPVDTDLITALSGASGAKRLEIGICLIHNIVTPQQLSFITGHTIFSVESRLRDKKLTAVYPFRCGKSRGPKFIARDEKFDLFISNYLLKNGK